MGKRDSELKRSSRDPAAAGPRPLPGFSPVQPPAGFRLKFAGATGTGAKETPKIKNRNTFKVRSSATWSAICIDRSCGKHLVA